MNKILTIFAVILFSFSSLVNAQVSDVVSLGAGYSGATFYRLSDGNKTNMNNMSWQFAIAVRPSGFPNNPMNGTVVRFNGQSGMKVYRVKGKTAANFTDSIDTTGLTSWPRLTDTDSSWDISSFNAHKSTNPYNFGWGTYNATSHNVEGDSMYFIKLGNGVVMRFLIEKLSYDTLWSFKLADADGKNVTSFTVNKRDYKGKNFVYYDVQNSKILDVQPLSADWDLYFGAYTAPINMGPTSVPDYRVTGVLSNVKILTAEARGIPASSANPADYKSKFISRINEIGYDWKTFLFSQSKWQVEDSLCYFVRTRDTNYYKIIFTDFGGSATGTIVFTKELVTSSMAIKENNSLTSIATYPNPAINTINVLFPSTKSTKATISMYDLTGKIISSYQVTTKSGLNNFIVNVDGFRKGFYLLKVNVEGESVSQKIQVQ